MIQIVSVYTPLTTLSNVNCIRFQVLSGLTAFPGEAHSNIEASMESIVTLMGSAIAPLLSSISDALEAIVLTIHQEDFSGYSSLMFLMDLLLFTDLPLILILPVYISF